MKAKLKFNVGDKVRYKFKYRGRVRKGIGKVDRAWTALRNLPATYRISSYSGIIFEHEMSQLPLKGKHEMRRLWKGNN